MRAKRKNPKRKKRKSGATSKTMSDNKRYLGVQYAPQDLKREVSRPCPVCKKEGLVDEVRREHIKVCLERYLTAPGEVNTGWRG